MWGDQIVLKNGDRVTGSIIKKDGKSLTIKTDHFGVVTTSLGPGGLSNGRQAAKCRPSRRKNGAGNYCHDERKSGSDYEGCQAKPDTG